MTTFDDGSFDAPAPLAGLSWPEKPSRDEMGRACSADRAPDIPAPTLGGSGPVCGPLQADAAPPDLLAFVQAQPVRTAARTLGIARGQVQRLRSGYWPRDDRALRAIWSRYLAESASVQGSDGVRRVQPDGSVGVRGCSYAGAPLVPGTLCLVKRLADGTLWVQPLRADGDALVLTSIEEPLQ